MSLSVTGDRWLLSAGTHMLPITAPSLSAGLATGYMDYYTQWQRDMQVYAHIQAPFFWELIHTRAHSHTHTPSPFLIRFPPLRR